MVNTTKIEWATHTSNPIKFRDAEGKSVWGCVRKSPGCAHCYAADLARRYGRGGKFTEEELAGYECYLDEKELRQLLSPKRLPAGSKCFLGDMTDVFGEWVPFEFLDRIFAVMALRPDVVFQLLTKRPERMREYLSGEPGIPKKWHVDHNAGILVLARNDRWPLPNVWLGTSVENQHWADIRIPELLATPAAVRFVSYEPALGPVDFLFECPICKGTGGGYTPTNECRTCKGDARALTGLDWVIVGGESGPGARPFDVALARSTVAQCRAAGVAVFVKQMGAKPYRVKHELRMAGPGAPTGLVAATVPVNEPLKLKSRKGSDMGEWPEDLRVREMPT